LLRQGASESGLAMDAAGWASVTETLRVAAMTRDELAGTVRMNDKGRLELDGERIRACQGHSLENMRQSQEAVVKMVRMWAEGVAGLMPELPASPFADQLPDPVEMIDRTFAFLDGLLATQKDFAIALLGAATPGPADAVPGDARPAGTRPEASAPPAKVTT
jgi:hypothetical protein